MTLMHRLSQLRMAMNEVDMAMLHEIRSRMLVTKHIDELQQRIASHGITERLTADLDLARRTYLMLSDNISTAQERINLLEAQLARALKPR